MACIRPISDLRNNFTEISKTLKETEEPIFLTKNGTGEMVVMSMEMFEKMHFESEVYLKLKETEREASIKEKNFTAREVLDAVKKAIEV